MAKKVAVLAVNPVNGFGLFQYLEAFFENGISYKVYVFSILQYWDYPDNEDSDFLQKSS